MRVRRSLSVAVGTAAVAAAVAGATSVAAGGAAAPAPAGPAVLISPDAVHARPADTHGVPGTGYCETTYHIACYQPAQLRAAYHVGPLYQRGITGKGQTIVIVDSFGSPTVRRDLARFDQAFHLPAPPSFTVIQPAGPVPPYRATSNREGWAGETDLDVEYSHAMAPGAKILLVETPTSENEGTTGFPQIVTAENYVINHHLGGVISQSFSATEQTFPSRQALLSLRSAYRNAAAKGVTVLTASGDSGAADVRFNQSTYYLHPVTSWPDSDPLVTGVGGTQLHLPGSGSARPATVWNDTYSVPTNQYIFGSNGPNPLAGGGGKSVIFSRPVFQNSVRSAVGQQRGVPDISMSAACNGAVVMYQSFPGQQAGWYPTCGTSEATPLFAGVVALADQAAGHPLGPINPALYALARAGAPGIVDVTSGNNTVSFRQGGKLHTVTGFTAGPGYDLASGLGTVNAAKFVPELVAAAHR
jgi:subtilase family serine protease